MQKYVVEIPLDEEQMTKTTTLAPNHKTFIANFTFTMRKRVSPMLLLGFIRFKIK
jgi:hypothetical protein